MWLPCDYHVTTMWLPCGCHVTNMWLTCEYHVTTMWLSCDTGSIQKQSSKVVCNAILYSRNRVKEQWRQHTSRSRNSRKNRCTAEGNRISLSAMNNARNRSQSFMWKLTSVYLPQEGKVLSRKQSLQQKTPELSPSQPSHVCSANLFCSILSMPLQYPISLLNK